MDSPLRLLVIEDVPADFLLVERHLREHGVAAECRRIAGDVELDAALGTEWDVVLSDYNVPGMDFRTTLHRIRQQSPDLPVILVSGSVGEETAVELLRLGLTDFILKDNLARLPTAVRRAMDEAAERRARRAAETVLRESQAAALEEQRQARLAALNLTEDALAARARAEAASVALQESEAKYRLLAENAADCIFWLGPDGRFNYVSPACEHISGHTPDEFLADPELMANIIHPDDRTAYRQHLEDSSHADVGELEFRVLLDDGTVRWIGHHCRPIHGGNGECLGRRGTNRDITQRKRAEVERDLFSEALRQSAQPLVLADSEARVTYLNPAFSRLFGYQLHDLAGEPVSRLAAPTDEAGREQAEILGRVRATGAWSGEVERMARDGTPIATAATIGAIRDDRGNLVGFVGSYHDLRPLQEREAMLRKLSLAVEQSPESIVITNVDAEIEYVNEAFVRVTGYSREEVIGQNPRILQSDRTPSETYNSLWAALAGGRPWKGEFHNKRKDGSEYVEFALVTPIRQPDGRITNYVAVKEDITDKKRIAAELDRHRYHLEELVEQRTGQLADAQARAEAANHAKSAFLANMSHEIRTPMNAILGLTHLMKRAGTTREQAERLDKIDSAGHHLLAIINDILDLSKIEAGKLDLESVDFHLSAILDNVHSLIAETARAKGLTIEVDRDAVPVWLRGDATRLRQALLNYASNAVKFTDRGSVALRAKLLEDGGDELWVRFEVEDTGIGIAADKLPQLFQAFEQADASNTRKYGGTGLGLAITRRLVELMDGEVGVTSEPGKGSSFWFTARLQRGRGITQAVAATDEAGAETTLRRHHSGDHLLLVEDNDINREVALELLHGIGLAVDTAENGRAALEQARRNAYDLILMDMQLPEMDGLEATRAIRRLPGCESLPILAMTANVFGEDRAACLAAGMNDHVPKPVDPEVLFAALLQWLPWRGAAGEAVTRGSRAKDAVLRERLAALPGGFDLELGLKAVRGKLPSLARLLRRFAEGHGEDAAELRRLWAAGELEQAGRLAHTLKGVAGTLGLCEVQEMAGALNATIRAGAAGEGHLAEALARTLEEAIEAIRMLPGPPPEAEVDPAMLQRATGILDRLEDLLVSSDFGATTLYGETAALLEAVLGGAAEEIGRLIGNYDYQQALQRLLAARANALPEERRDDRT